MTPVTDYGSRTKNDEGVNFKGKMKEACLLSVLAVIAIIWVSNRVERNPREQKAAQESKLSSQTADVGAPQTRPRISKEEQSTQCREHIVSYSKEVGLSNINIYSVNDMRDVQNEAIGFNVCATNLGIGSPIPGIITSAVNLLIMAKPTVAHH